METYQFGVKNQWRRWAWNRATELLLVEPKDAIVLYLAGHEDLDRKEALRRGYRDENLIAVDRSGAVVKALRHAGALAMQCDLHDAMGALPPSMNVDVVIADYTSDLNDAIKNRWKTAVRLSALLHSVFVVNLCRGRAPGNRDFHAYFNELLDSSQSAKRGERDFRDPGMAKHRGMQLFVWTMYQTLHHPGQKSELAHFIAHWADPKFYSYRSENGQYFDSVVFANPHQCLNATQLEAARAVAEDHRSTKQKQVARKLAALRAHRTMRKNGIFRREASQHE